MKILIQTGFSRAVDEKGTTYKRGPAIRATICEYCDTTIEQGENSWECQTGGDERWESACKKCVVLVSALRCVELYQEHKATHRARHTVLHGHLEELVADWVGKAKGQPLTPKRMVFELMKWSEKQAEGPDH